MTRQREIAALGVLIVGLYFALAYGMYSGVTSRMLGANDFYSRWAGARALFLRGENPYSDVVTREIQMGMYGRLALPNEDQVAFAYPLYSAFVAAPLVGLPYAQAQAMWMAFLALAVASASIALMQFLQPTRLIVQTLLVIATLVFYPSVRAIFNGQYAIVSFFFIALAIAFISARHDIAAGVFIALSTVKPQTALFLVPAIVLWAWRNRRWQIVIAAAVVISALVLGSLWLVPTWIFDFAQGLRQYNEYEPIGPPLQIVIEFLVADPTWRALVLGASLIILVGWVIWRLVRTKDESWEGFFPTLGLIAIVTTIWAGRIGSSDQVLLLIPWLGWQTDWVRQGKITRAIFGALVILILPWFVFLNTLRGNAENIGVSLILPFFSLIVYLLQNREIQWRSRPA